MSKSTTKQNDKPITTALKLGSVVKSARDIMRTDKGLNGELDPPSVFDLDHVLETFG